MGTVFPLRNIAETILWFGFSCLVVVILRAFLTPSQIVSVLLCSVILDIVIILPGIRGASFFEFAAIILRYELKKNRQNLNKSGYQIKEKHKSSLHLSFHNNSSAAADPLSDIVIRLKPAEEEQ